MKTRTIAQTRCWKWNLPRLMFVDSAETNKNKITLNFFKDIISGVCVFVCEFVCAHTCVCVCVCVCNICEINRPRQNSAHIHHTRGSCFFANFNVHNTAGTANLNFLCHSWSSLRKLPVRSSENEMPSRINFLCARAKLQNFPEDKLQF